MEQEQLKLNISLDKTQPILSENGEPLLLAEGVILRKANKFLTGTQSDALIPIPVFYDATTKKIALDMLPAEIRDEYKNVGFSFTTGE